jgi:hypothetical protein
MTDKKEHVISLDSIENGTMIRFVFDDSHVDIDKNELIKLLGTYHSGKKPAKPLNKTLTHLCEVLTESLIEEYRANHVMGKADSENLTLKEMNVRRRFEDKKGYSADLFEQFEKAVETLMKREDSSISERKKGLIVLSRPPI